MVDVDFGLGLTEETPPVLRPFGGGCPTRSGAIIGSS